MVVKKLEAGSSAIKVCVAKRNSSRQWSIDPIGLAWQAAAEKVSSVDYIGAVEQRIETKRIETQHKHQRELGHKTAVAVKRGWLLKLGSKGLFWKKGYYVLLAAPEYELRHFDGFACSSIQSTLALGTVLRVERDTDDLSAAGAKAAQALSRVGGMPE
jgi:hypothetical protein